MTSAPVLTLLRGGPFSGQYVIASGRAPITILTVPRKPTVYDFRPREAVWDEVHRWYHVVELGATDKEIP